MEEDVKQLVRMGIAVELLVPPAPCDEGQVGVRLRTYGKSLPRNKMIMADGDTFTEALTAAIERAVDGRWENLDWAARPWACSGGNSNPLGIRL